MDFSPMPPFCEYVCMCIPQGEWRSEDIPREPVLFLRHVMGSQGLNSSHQAWQQACLLTEPSIFLVLAAEVPIIPAVHEPDLSNFLLLWTQLFQLLYWLRSSFQVLSLRVWEPWVSLHALQKIYAVCDPSAVIRSSCSSCSFSALCTFSLAATGRGEGGPHGSSVESPPRLVSEA